MDSLELIDDYFKGLLTGEQQKQVEQRILSDPAFAKELAFYLSAHDAVKQELTEAKKARFRELYEQSKTASENPDSDTSASGYPSSLNTAASGRSAPRRTPVRRTYFLAAAAAAVVILVAGDWALFFRHPKPQQLADNYIAQHLSRLDERMSSFQDSLQVGVQQYNNGDLQGAATTFKTILQHHPDNEYALQNTGLVYLRLREYDKALDYFQQLGADTTLYINPGLFYQSITLMERHRPGDDVKAKAQLQEVVDRRLGMKEEAQQLLSKW
jgi:tetratricopeptide (TPR) repeat protein